MTGSIRRRELGRGERVLPGLWRLRLPLPWPGIPHCNAWAIAADGGIVLVDTGYHGPGSLDQLERALATCGRTLEDVRLLVCTHAHADHYGEAATIVGRIGCELWMHPAHAHTTAAAADPEDGLRRRLEIARASGLPPDWLEQLAEAGRSVGSGVAAVITPDRALVDGVEVETDLGTWTAWETPGHAPSHVCLFQPERRLLLSGDHLLGRVSVYFDHGYSPDPVGEFLHSLDVVEKLDARLCLPGHGRTFSNVQAHIVANRTLVGERMSAALAVVTERGPLTAFDVVAEVSGEALTPTSVGWWLNETLCYLAHLEALGVVERDPSGELERWRGVLSENP